MLRIPIPAVAIALLLGPILADLLPAGERYAFLVGVREYAKTELTNLQFPENDINVLSEALQAAGYPRNNVVLMTVPAGTAKGGRYLPLAKNIRQELMLLLETIGEEDTLIVALAGHGVQFKGETGAYFCPLDARLSDRTTLIALDDVYRALERCPARNKLLLVDACRNDPQSALSRSAKTVELEAVGRPQAGKLPKSISALYSCSAGQQAFEDPELKHGVFFYYVIEALRGAADVDRDSQVSLDELKLYAVKRVQARVRVELGQLQTPQYAGEGAGDMPLASLRAGAGQPSITDVPPIVEQPNGPVVRIDASGQVTASVRGETQWSRSLEKEYPGPVHGTSQLPGVFAVVKGNQVIGLDPATGAVHWTVALPAGGQYSINGRGDEFVVQFLPSGMPSRTFLVNRATGERRERAPPAGKPYFGSIPDFARQEEGYAVGGVSAGGPAALAGIQQGDVIVGMGGSKVQGLDDFNRLLGGYYPEDRVSVVIRRGNREITLEVVIGSRP